MLNAHLHVFMKKIVRFDKNILTAVFLSIFAFAAVMGQSALTFTKTAEAVINHPELGRWLFDLQPTIYITPEGMNTYGEGAPLVVECTPNKISQLYEENASFAEVKVLKLNIRSSADLVVLQLSKLKSFSSLKYVQLVFVYDICGGGNERCLLTKAKNIIAAGSVSATILYQLSIPE